jgi:hypothetical protein
MLGPAVAGQIVAAGIGPLVMRGPVMSVAAVRPDPGSEQSKDCEYRKKHPCHVISPHWHCRIEMLTAFNY